MSVKSRKDKQWMSERIKKHLKIEEHFAKLREDKSRKLWNLTYQKSRELAWKI